MNTKKNLVIGSGRGYSWYILEPFIRSFTQNVSNADLVLFADDISDFTRYMLEEIGKNFHGGVMKIFPFPDELKTRHPANARWKMFADYIGEHHEEYEQILISDTRDVIFQDDVFKCFENEKKYVGYAEDFGDVGGKVFGGIHYWIKDTFNEEEASKMDEKICVCPGTVIGSSNEIKILVQKMIEYMPRNVDFYGEDQAVYVYIVHNHLVPVENEIFIDCWKGAILSTEWFHSLNPIKFDGKNILRGDGGIPALVHQYDKHPETAQFVSENYHDKRYRLNEKFTDIKSMCDQLPHLIISKNLNESLKLFVNYLLGKTDFVGCGTLFADYWQILLLQNSSELQSEILEVAFQRVIISAFKDGIYVNQARCIMRCLELCKKNNRVLTTDFEEWLKSRIIKMVKFHLENKNSFRYEMCINLMSRAGLVNHKYFYILQAEVLLMSDKKYLALENYKTAAGFKNSPEKEKLILEEYKLRMRENIPENFKEALM
ncbi:MAG: hypothetical protein IK062_00215 [Selenomonadaceae bacterium]|nr:hypothetical protein [Selenomonadaceae bacterium]